jgi:hypothetical protein
MALGDQSGRCGVDRGRHCRAWPSTPFNPNKALRPTIFAARVGHQIGLVVLIVATLLNTAYSTAYSVRPRRHAPVERHPADNDDDEEPEEADHKPEGDDHCRNAAAVANAAYESPARLAFEYGHRVLGLTAILLTWFHVASSDAELLHQYTLLGRGGRRHPDGRPGPSRSCCSSSSSRRRNNKIITTSNYDIMCRSTWCFFIYLFCLFCTR